MSIREVREIMTGSPQCCSAQDTTAQAARLMADGNFGCVPVTDPRTNRLQGVLTDRDITCRVVARGLDPNRTPVRDAMSTGIASLSPEATIQECIRLMEARQVRRVPIVDDRGNVIGIVAQADVARATAREPAMEHELVELVEEVSEPQHVLRAS